MLGLRLTEFIERLRLCDVLAEYDVVFLKKITEKFISLRAFDNLTFPQFFWLQQIFSERWQLIVNNPEENYIGNLTGSNECWRRFAVDLVHGTEKSYLQLLMPTIKNSHDPNTQKKLVDYNDFHDFYIGTDGKTLYTLSGLCELYQEKKILFSYGAHRDSKKYTPYALSLSELLQLRSKKDSFRFTTTIESYDSFWSYFSQTILVDWKRAGELPRHLLPMLLDVVDCFFVEQNEGKVPRNFREKLILWTQYVQESRIDDVNHLYGIKIQVNGASVYLIDILLNFIQCEPSTLQHQMLGVARWLSEYDPSFLSACTELNKMKVEYNLGPAFSFSSLQTHLSELLLLNLPNSTKRSITLLSESCIGKKDFDPEVLTKLREIYRLRWLQVQGKNDDYTRLQTGKNTQWIRLAQLLSAEGLIEENYYHFLMPTLTTGMVLGECLTAYPLSHYILSEDARSLIYLGHCEHHYKALGTFYNCNTVPPLPLTDTELGRVRYASSRFHKFMDLAVDDPDIARETVIAVYDLVNNSLYPIGLKDGYDYTQVQAEAADKAYQTFCIFLHTLPPAEMQKLLSQHIAFFGKNLTFKQVMEEVEDDKCIAVCGQFFAKMVMDYAPHLRFSPELESKSFIHDMRKKSCQKVFSNYSAIDDAEAKRRLQILAVSLMTHPFDYSWAGESLSFWDCSNTLSSITKNAYQILVNIVKTGDFKHARFIYASIMESVINPALVNTNFLTWLTRTSVTQNWLESVKSNALFNQFNAWFHPGLLFATIVQLKFEIAPPSRRLLDSFIEEFLHTYAQSQSTSLKDVRINIKFTQLLPLLEPQTREQLMRALKSSTKQVDEKGFYSLYAHHIIARLALLGAGVSGQQQSVPFLSRAYDKPTLRRIEDIKKIVSDAVSSENYSLSALFKGLSFQIDSITGAQQCDERAKSRMKGFLERIQSPILSAEAHPQQDVEDELQASPAAISA